MKAQPVETECLIIGGGPAGLTAAIYLARFRRNVLVIDKGESRAEYIKSSNNYPGFINGINGNQLLINLREQAKEYGAELITDEVTALELDGDGIFTATTPARVIKAKKVLLATGIVDEKPNLPNMDKIIYEGAVRFCPVCDGFEATDKKIGIVGTLKHILPKALFLRTYTRQIFLLPTHKATLTKEETTSLHEANIQLPGKDLTDLIVSHNKVTAVFDDNEKIELDVLYPAMGADVRSELAIKLNAKANESNCILADAHQLTSINGLYVAGDLTTDLSQISVALGQAAIAATHIHNNLPANFR